MRKVVISGAGGFLGRHLVEILGASGQVEVCALTSHPADMKSLSDANCQIVNLDNLILGKVDCDNGIFVNCLFPTNADGFSLAAGLEKVASVLNCARSSHASACINVSSQSIYGSKRDHPAREIDSPCLETLYATGKFCSELLCDAIFASVPHSNIRLASLLGATYSQRIVNRMVRYAFETQTLQVVGGRQRYGFLDVRDAARGLAAMILGDFDSWRQIYNLGSHESYSLMDIARMIVQIMRELCEIKVDINVAEGSDERSSALDSSLFSKDFGWHPSIAIKETIQEIVLVEREAMQRNGE